MTVGHSFGKARSSWRIISSHSRMLDGEGGRAERKRARAQASEMHARSESEESQTHDIQLLLSSLNLPVLSFPFLAVRNLAVTIASVLTVG